MFQRAVAVAVMWTSRVTERTSTIPAEEEVLAEEAEAAENILNRDWHPQPVTVLFWNRLSESPGNFHRSRKVKTELYPILERMCSSDESGLAVAKRSISLDRENNKVKTGRDSSLDNADRRNTRQIVTNKIPPFLLLSQVSGNYIYGSR